MDKQKLKDKNWLEQKYQESSVEEISELLNCYPSTIFRALKRYGIKIKIMLSPSEERNCVCGNKFIVGGRNNGKRNQRWCSNSCRMLHDNPSPNGHSSHAPRPKKNKDTLHNEQWLRSKYLEEKLSTTDIARVCNCSVHSVWWALNKFNIEVRPMSEAKVGRVIKGRHDADNETSVGRQRQREYEKKQLLKLEMIEAYGGKCQCPGGCDVKETEFLTLDHIGGGGSKDRKESGGSNGLLRKLKTQGWPKDKYRILCMNCNLATKFGRMCPHQLNKG